MEDYEALGRGFNLHKPVANKSKGIVDIGFNIFEPERVNLSVYSARAKKLLRFSKDRQKTSGYRNYRGSQKRGKQKVILS